MLKIITLILLLEGIDKDEYFGFGQCLMSSVQSLIINFLFIIGTSRRVHKDSKSPQGERSNCN